jgi:hypothetical protein
VKLHQNNITAKLEGERWEDRRRIEEPTQPEYVFLKPSRLGKNYAELFKISNNSIMSLWTPLQSLSGHFYSFLFIPLQSPSSNHNFSASEFGPRSEKQSARRYFPHGVFLSASYLFISHPPICLKKEQSPSPAQNPPE